MAHRKETADYSPQNNLRLLEARLSPGFPCLIAIGKEESDEFHRQGEEFHQVSMMTPYHMCPHTVVQGLLSVGVASTNSTHPDRDHFSLTEELTNTNDLLTQSIMEFITPSKSHDSHVD